MTVPGSAVQFQILKLCGDGRSGLLRPQPRQGGFSRSMLLCEAYSRAAGCHLQALPLGLMTVSNYCKAEVNAVAVIGIISTSLDTEHQI